MVITKSETNRISEYIYYTNTDFTFYYMVDMVHYSWSTEKLPDESFYFFCSFWSKSFVSFSLKLLNMAISMSKFVSKICYYSESSKCDTQYPFGYGYIMQKDEMGNCVWVEGDFFRFTHLFILCCKFILRIFILEWRSPKLYHNFFQFCQTLYRNIFGQYKSFPLWTTKSNAEKSRS